MSVETRARHPALPAASVSAGPAPSRRCEPSAISTAESEDFEQSAPIQFAFLFAFSVPRSKHPRPADARSPSRVSNFQCGLLHRSKLLSPSTDLFHSPWEWTATAHGGRTGIGSIKYVGMDLYKETTLIDVRNQVALESRDCRKFLDSGTICCCFKKPLLNRPTKRP
jgi:hypothetical protein